MCIFAVCRSITPEAVFAAEEADYKVRGRFDVYRYAVVCFCEREKGNKGF